ncbi:MAG TPA: M14 metallopeptidase family protein [Bryobacteraceae bacterium]|nr:M14 metallopeptidase family protein [Bryobacteraceae bacterium]
MLTRVSFAPLLLCFVALAAAPPAPKEHLGYEPGADYKLANYNDIMGYFRKLEAASDRIRLAEFGRTSEGRPMYLAYISSPENLRRLDRWREISRRLALGQATPDEARALAREGKAIVWIDSGLHATEVAPAQHAPVLAHRMITDESEEIRRIRDRVILIQVPSINPDGLDMVVKWYRRNVGTPWETAPLPSLYQKYSGHDNNRDYFMMNLAETRHVSRQLFQEWFPQIVYNQHQAPAFPARIFVPPYADPLNPNIPAPVMEGINLIGAAMKERFARENKPGVLSYIQFDAWWNGGLRSVPAFHNMHGILTETALHAYATPREYRSEEFPDKFSNGALTREPSMFYQRPWMGGTWGVRDAIEYMLTADFAILDLAASRAPEFLLKAWEMAQANIETGKKQKPWGYAVAADQENAAEIVSRLMLAGIEVQRARGRYILPAAQPFRPYLVDLMEPQKYPDTGRRPYDVAGWTLWMNMGVQVERLDDAPGGNLERVTDPPHEKTRFTIPPRRRIALYQPSLPNMDTGWTQWLFDYYAVPHKLVPNQDIRRGELRATHDVIILASQPTNSILNGWRPGERVRRRRPGEAEPLPHPEYTGGIGISGLAELDRFVREGGTLMTFDESCELPVQMFGLPLRKLNTASNYDNPGSVIRITVDTEHPIGAGMPATTYAYSTDGQAWDITLDHDFNKGERAVRVVARYAAKDVLASGWLTGEKVVAGKPLLVEARHGKGRVVLFGFRPQFRGQTFGTFRLIFNAMAEL